MNVLKKIILGGSIIASLYSPMKAIAQNNSMQDDDTTKIEKVERNLEGKINFASLEAGLTHKVDPRIRGIVNSSITYKNVELGYWGLHETDGKNWYFSRSVPTIGKKDAKTKSCAVLKTDQKGIFDIKYGIRNTSLPSRIADYGWTTLSGNKEGAELAFFLGKDLGNGFSTELFNTTNIKYDGNVNNYSELQINKKITKHINCYGRFELGIGNGIPNKSYLLGLSISK